MKHKRTVKKKLQYDKNNVVIVSVHVVFCGVVVFVYVTYYVIIYYC